MLALVGENVTFLHSCQFRNKFGALISPELVLVFFIVFLESALTGELKIVRMDHCTSPAKGGREIFMLVERVTKSK
jgi:hypothetical protein